LKLVVQIPCYNEAQTLPAVLQDIPRKLDGVDDVKILVVDDGSTDGSAQVAQRFGADKIFRIPTNRGLAHAFRIGLEQSLLMDADIIVNFDADHQYRGDDIPKLIEPILGGCADLVVGARDLENFGLLKRFLEKLGSRVVKAVAGIDVVDAPSGFRALSREAALRLQVFSSFTYTIETLIQAGQSGVSVDWVSVKTNPVKRPSRLFSSIFGYLARSIVTILRITTLYRPLKVFSWLGVLVSLPGFLLGVRFLYYFIFTPAGARGHVQSLILAAILIIVGFQMAVFGFLADLISANRRLIEQALYLVKRRELLDERGDSKEGDAPL